MDILIAALALWFSAHIVLLALLASLAPRVRGTLTFKWDGRVLALGFWIDAEEGWLYAAPFPFLTYGFRYRRAGEDT